MFGSTVCLFDAICLKNILIKILPIPFSIFRKPMFLTNTPLKDGPEILHKLNNSIKSV